MVDVVRPIVRVVYPLPAEGELVLLAVLGPLLLDPGQPRVQPVRGACKKENISEVGLKNNSVMNSKNISLKKKTDNSRVD